MKKKIPTKKKSVKKEQSVDIYTNDDVKGYIGFVTENFTDQIRAVAEQISGIYERQDAHTEMIGGIKEDMEVVMTNIEIIKSDLSRKVDYSDFSALEKRVRLVEAKLHR